MDNKNFKKIADEEIDLKKIYFLLMRKKNLIFKFSIFGIIIGLFIAFSSKKVWEGEFQIVLENNSQKLPSNINSGLAELAGLGPKKDTLKTEVGILKSPSVLMKIFEFVKKEKIKNDDNSLTKKGFRHWMESVEIDLEKNTSILNVSYRDKDKNLILPVLKMISSTYQEYSGKKRNRDLELAVNYFEDQISIYKVKSLESLKKVNQFAIKNDLPRSGFDNLNNTTDSKNINDSGINIEYNRISASNRIRLSEQLLKQFEKISNDNDQIISFGEKIDEVSKSISFRRIKQIDKEISKNRLAYKENDRNLKNLISERSSLILLIKDQIKNNLISEITLANAAKKSSERPEGVLTTYMQLLSNSNKESNTLFNLEKQYRASLLEKARSEDPWELITTPTLYPNAVAPNKKLIVFLYLFSAVIIGSVISLILENKRDLIYSTNDLELFSDWSFTSEFTSIEKSYLDESFQLIANGHLAKKDNETAFLLIGNIDESIVIRLNESLKSIFLNQNIIITTNFIELNNFKNIVGIIKTGTTRKKDLKSSLEKLNLQKRKFLGLIILNELSF